MKTVPPSIAGFAQGVLDERALVYDLRATLRGEQRYFIVKVMPAKQAVFLRAVEKDAGFRIEDYGEILHRGCNEPEEALKEQLRIQYGMYYDA